MARKKGFAGSQFIPKRAKVVVVGGLDLELPNLSGAPKFNNDARAYGSMYNHDVATTVTIGGTNTPVRVPSGFTVGQTNHTTFQNSREIVVLKRGIYLITWQISFTTASANQEIEGFPMVNNVMSLQASAHRRIATGTDTGSMSGTCILNLVAGSIISLGVLNETAAVNVIVEHANISIVNVG